MLGIQSPATDLALASSRQATKRHFSRPWLAGDEHTGGPLTCEFTSRLPTLGSRYRDLTPSVGKAASLPLAVGSRWVRGGFAVGRVPSFRCHRTGAASRRCLALRGSDGVLGDVSKGALISLRWGASGGSCARKARPWCGLMRMERRSGQLYRRGIGCAGWVRGHEGVGAVPPQCAAGRATSDVLCLSVRVPGDGAAPTNWARRPGFANLPTMTAAWVVRSRLLACLLVALLVSAACSTESQDVTNERRAAVLTDLLARNDWSGVRKDFNPSLRAGLSEATLASAWKQVTAKVGSYRSRGEPRVVTDPRGATAFDTLMTFERGEMRSRVSFGTDGLVSALLILEP